MKVVFKDMEKSQGLVTRAKDIGKNKCTCLCQPSAAQQKLGRTLNAWNCPPNP